MVELALRLTREAQVIEEEYFLPQTRKVLVTTTVSYTHLAVYKRQWLSWRQK